MRGARLGLAAILACSGCAVGPNYRRPDTHPPATFRGQAAAETASFADANWWEIYQDPVLTGLIRRALDNGFDARIAAVRVEQARAVALEAGGQYYPAVGYVGDAFRGKNTFFGSPDPEGGGATADAFAPYLSASWELDIWGRLRRLNEAARSQYLESEEGRRAVRLTVLANVAQDYFDLLELDAELAIARQATRDFGDSLRLFNERLKGGIASRLETSSAAAAQAAEAAQVPLLERQIALTENQIHLLLGENPGPVARGPALAEHRPPPETPAGLPSALLERRPDVREAEYAARAANAQIGATIGGFLPRFGLSALLGSTSQSLSALTHTHSELWSAGLNITGPLFQGGALRGEYLQAKSAWRLAKLQYEQTALSAFGDVANALVTRQKLAEAGVQLAREVQAYQDAVHVASERYRAGEAGYYELLQAQEQLYPAESALAQNHRDELIAAVQLYKALGGGWNNPP
ncbi:MAG TPA: efflux transporter outer membrane subunit [Opitutaceae bacterium]|jgi:multidrug efflux system outer membrane protein|nr:efflux transporter outer membrane subunit [Opitutaceae bacterium]